MTRAEWQLTWKMKEGGGEYPGEGACWVLGGKGRQGRIPRKMPLSERRPDGAKSGHAWY